MAFPDSHHSMDELRRLDHVYAERRRRGLDRRYLPYEPANLFRVQHLERDLARSLDEAGLLPIEGLRALDVGCGGGWWPRTLLRWGARPEQVVGLDALPEALRGARAVHPALPLVRASAAGLPFAAASFDLVSQFTVFSSMLDASTRRSAAGELLRVLRPGGTLLWYDFTVNPTNRNTIGLDVRDVMRLFPGQALRVRRVTLAPPLARWVVPRSWLAAELLEAIPLLRTHLLITIRKVER